MLRRTIAIVAVAVALIAIGCGNKEEPTKKNPPPKAGPKPTTPSKVDRLAANPDDTPAMAEAKRTFKSTCAQCHGESGRGDGIAAASLPVKPRNYTDKKWQESVTDEWISNTILKGGAMMGKSALMPANPQLQNKPEVLAALVKLIRSFAE